MNDLKIKVLFNRFLRGFGGGFLGSAVSIGIFAGQSVRDLFDWLALLGIAGLAGGVTGGLLALEKGRRWKNELAK